MEFPHDVGKVAAQGECFAVRPALVQAAHGLHQKGARLKPIRP
jgi:hypothetical protein